MSAETTAREHAVEGLCGVVMRWAQPDAPSLGGEMPTHVCAFADRVDGCTIRSHRDAPAAVPSLHVQRLTRMAQGKTFCACGSPWPCLGVPAASDAGDSA